MGRNKLGVQADGELDALPEVLSGDMRNGNGGSRVLHALRIRLGTEDVDSLVVGRAVGLQALVALLAVVEGRCHSMDAEER